MNKHLCLILLLTIAGFNTSLHAEKVKPVVEKETIKAEQQAILLKKPDAKVKHIKYDDGGVYVGEILKKLRNGLGTMFYANGDIYRGDWYIDVISGYGIKNYTNGNYYDGEWKDGLYEGKGIMHFASGAEYEGDWKEGKYEGHGILKYATGEVYDGAWSAGKQEGLGKLSYVGGDYYEGGWVEGRRSGEGVYSTPSKGLVIKGFWNDSYLSGDGSITYLRDTANLEIAGRWLDNDRFETDYAIAGKSFTGLVRPMTGNADSGPVILNGRVFWNDANYLEGEWQDGTTVLAADNYSSLQNGNEKYSADGLSYEFEIKGGKRDAGSIALSMDYLSLSGTLKNDAFNGPLALMRSDVDRLTMESIWENGGIKEAKGSFNDQPYVLAACPDEPNGLHVFSLTDAEGKTKQVVWAEEEQDGIVGVAKECAAPISLSNAVVLGLSRPLACVMKDGKWGAISESGRLFIPLQHDSADAFSKEVEPAADAGFIFGMKRIEDNGKFGFISMEGKLVVPLTYDFAADYSDSLALVKAGDKWAFLDKEGQVVLQPEFDAVSSFAEGMACVAKDGKYGFIAKNGEIVVPLDYDYAANFSNGFACVGKDGKYGFINAAGEVVIPMEYDGVLTGRILK